MTDLGGHDGTVDYRGAEQQPTHETMLPLTYEQAQQFYPQPVPGPPDRAADRVVVDLYTPGTPGAQLPPPTAGEPAYPVHYPAAEPGSYRPAFPMPAPGFAAPPQPVAVPPQPSEPQVPRSDDPATQRMFDWLLRRGVAPAFLTSYARARDIVWGGEPGGPVAAHDIEAALASRAPTATPQQLSNLRDLAMLLVQYYGVRPEPAPEPEPADEDEDDDDGSRPLELDLPRVRSPPTPVPVLLQQSRSDMASDDTDDDVPDDVATGAEPLVKFRLDDEPAAAFPDSPAWSMPAGFASAWDPRTRDQRPSEILRHPRSPVVTYAIVLGLLAAVAAAVYVFALS